MARYHLLPLAGLALWGVVRVSSAGTMTVAFWLAWLTYGVLVIWAWRGSRAGFWLALAVPATWLLFSISDLLPHLVDYPMSRQPWVLIDLLLVPVPCLIACIALLRRRWRPAEDDA